MRSALAARLTTLLAVALVAPGAAAARETEEPTLPGHQSKGLMTIFGLSGVRQMVDSRIPGQNMFRLFARGILALESRESATSSQSTFSYGGGITLGVPLEKRLELGAFIPIYFEKRTTNGAVGHGSLSEVTGPLWTGDVAGKIGGALDWISEDARRFSVSPYVIGHISEDGGISLLGGYQAVEAGFAEGVSFLEDQVHLNVNTAFAYWDPGMTGFRWRAGALVVPPALATKDFVPRLSFYVDGLERGYDGATTLDVAFAVQFIVLRTLLIDTNGSYRVLAQALPPGFHDDGTGGFVASLGFRVAF